MNDELKLKHNEMRKLDEWNKCLLFYLWCGLSSSRVQLDTFFTHLPKRKNESCYKYEYYDFFFQRSNLRLILINIKNV
jgi:hypothetical protein